MPIPEKCSRSYSGARRTEFSHHANMEGRGDPFSRNSLALKQTSEPRWPAMSPMPACMSSAFSPVARGGGETFSARTAQALQIGMKSAHLALLKTKGANALSQTVTHEGNQPNDILGVKEAAKYLHCSPSHVSNILNGKIPNLPPIPHVRAGRLRLIRRESLVRWLDEQETASRVLRQR